MAWFNFIFNRLNSCLTQLYYCNWDLRKKKLRFGKPLQSAKQSVTNPFVGKYIDYA
jgi:hypothetical protein